jgi:hypothetical protein
MKLNRIRFWTVAFAILTCNAGNAFAQMKEGTYFEAGYSSNTIKDETGFLGSFNNGALKLTLGSEVTQNLAIEGSIGTGMGDDTNVVQGVPVTVQTKEFFSLYARPFIKLSDPLEVFARAGYFRGKINASANGVSTNETQGDFSYGGGLAFNVSPASAIVIDYMMYFDKDNTRVTGFGFGYRQRF